MKDLFRMFRHKDKMGGMDEMANGMGTDNMKSDGMMDGSMDDKVCIPKDNMVTPMEDSSMMSNGNMTSSTMTHSPSPTVVELFQSQGCSSCPPANDNVIPLADDSDKLVLTYEVTYWDYLGWPDTFANKAWDQRQRDYSAAFRSKSVYTPQVIVNGVSYGVGSRQKELQTILHDGKSAPLASSASVTVSTGQVTITGPDNSKGIVQLVLYDPQNHKVAIGGGENRGRNLPHRNIVRDLTVLGTWEGGKQQFPLPELNNADGLKAAIIIQNGRGGAIIAATKI
ncbi:hypothetical protein Clacol_002059 [Clathrus columnatus]|uniref:DUF1223 domain-containing protein n=1 Tax=Clathrus columnatus TaxID=1419009 RepID=A0AAV5A3R5_9AGAM|nr:hypothetical protein Clacol_002059 [Clathrus columnatus]